MRHASDPERRFQQILLDSIKRAEMWIQSQTVKGASEGESSVNTLYGEILKRISTLPLEANPPLADAVRRIEERVEQLETRSKQYAQYGLLPEFNGRDILAIMKSAPRTHLSIISNIITPYVESVEKKLDAMERLQTQIDALVSIVNSFFARKKINFEIHQGFSITAEDGKELMPQMLSSGERHLLLLFCNTLNALNRPSIFMIDEPEISLNIKWQRRLLSSLLECVGKNPVQYLFATHSFEILAQYKENAAKLGETSEGLDGRKTDS
jgi:AAA15 family ATPase/GTPase